ncbi:MAG: S26 family signal peptidase, partial [Cellulosilyticaceae bacterium]
MKEPMLAVLAALLINQFLFMHTRVPTGSMEKTIMPKDHLVV